MPPYLSQELPTQIRQPDTPFALQPTSQNDSFVTRYEVYPIITPLHRIAKPFAVSLALIIINRQHNTLHRLANCNETDLRAHSIKQYFVVNELGARFIKFEETVGLGPIGYTRYNLVPLGRVTKSNRRNDGVRTYEICTCCIGRGGSINGDSGISSLDEISVDELGARVTTLLANVCFVLHDE